MKIRTGFVSNSSSTSFCIYGINAGEMSYDKYEELYKRIDKFGLEAFNTPWDTVYIGRSWALIKDDETGAQFKEAVKQALKESDLFLDETKLGTHEEAWRDG